MNKLYKRIFICLCKTFNRRDAETQKLNVRWHPLGLGVCAGNTMNKLYKRIFICLLFSLSFSFSNAQWVTIPDSNFVNWLNNNGYSQCMNGNLMDTTCNTIISTHSISISYQNISDLSGIQYFDSLNTLWCSYDSLTFLPALPSILLYLHCEGNQLSYLPTLPPNLWVLHCENNQLTSLPTLPLNLNYLYCSSNPLISLPTIPSGLFGLYCNYDQLTSLPSLPNSLTNLNCYHNQLTSLPQLPPSLQILECYNNLLTSLPTLPPAMTYLTCNYNQLSFLPSLPVSLNHLECWNNLLTSLPSLPVSLNYLHCQNNQLTSLPILPASLTYFNCGANLLSSLPPLPSSLTYLACGYNQLTSLPNFPSSLSSIFCSNSQLLSLPDLPDSVYALIIRDNPSLTCFPKYKKIVTLNWRNTGITCLPNAGYILYTDTTIINLPLCLPATGCNFHWNQFGKVYNDTNSNCINNVSEIKLKNIPVLLDSGGNNLQLFVTNNEGYYSFETGLGNYEIKIDTTGLPFDVTCPIGGNYLSSLTTIDSLDADLDFGVQCKPGYLDLIAKSIVHTGTLRPGAQRTLYLNAGDAALFYGVTCSNGINGTVTAVLDGAITYVAPAVNALTPSIINGDTLIWNVADFSLVNPTKDFNVIIQVDSSAVIGDTVCVSLSISSSVTDNNPANNFVSHCFPIVNSVDPNAKEIYPGGLVDSSNHSFTFTIYFQNTGNTVAENIYITDTLDADLDANTFLFLSSSHDAITQLLPGNILRFSFPQILLADSNSNEPASHGYVQFKINRKDTVYTNMAILNTAHIFFDLNAPVATNEAFAYLNFDCNSLIALAVSDTSVCENDNISFSNNVSFPFAVSNDWYVDSVLSSSAQAFNFSAINAGFYQIILTASNSFCSVSQTQNVTVYGLPAQPVIQVSGDTLSTSNAVSYQWYLNNSLLGGATQNSLVISQSGYYSVLITDSNGCNALSDSMFVSPVGIIEIGNSAFTISPNPVINNELIIVFRSADNNSDGSEGMCELFDATGKKVFSQQIVKQNSQQTFHLPMLAEGMYQCIIRSDDKIATKKIVVTRE